MNGTEMLGKNIQVDWAFKTAPIKDKQNKWYIYQCDIVANFGLWASL